MEITRCKDCEKFKPGHSSKRFGMCQLLSIPMWNTDFCSYAVPKMPEVENDVHCKDCKHLMFSDCYGECSKAHKGIVNPDDYCGRGERR